MWWEMKTLLTRNNIVKYWELPIGMFQFSSAMVYEGLSGVSDNREDDKCEAVDSYQMFTIRMSNNIIY